MGDYYKQIFLENQKCYKLGFYFLKFFIGFKKILKHDEASYHVSLLYYGKSYDKSQDPWLRVN